MKRTFNKAKKQVVIASGAALTFAAGAANAALSEEVSDLFDTAGADAALLFASAVALWASIRGMTMVFRLGSKFLSKAGV